MNEKTIPFDADLAEEKMINNAVRAQQEKARQEAELAKCTAENNRRMAQAAREYRVAKIRRIGVQAFAWLAGCSALVILSRLGHLSGWLMYLTTTVWSLHLGCVFGREAD